MADDLEERLRAHGRAFEGLLSLIPAKYYYEQDNNDQWQKKKQTKEERYQARKAKLDPDNIKSAKDVMDERALKRKRELHGDDEESIDLEGKERPREGLKDAKKVKKQKTNNPDAAHDTEAADHTKAENVPNPDDRVQKKLQKRKEKRERKKEMAAEQKIKDKEKKKRRRAAHKAAGKESSETKQDPAADATPVDAPQDPETTTLEPDQSLDLPIRAPLSASNSPLAESTFSEAQPASSKSSPPPLDDRKIEFTLLSKTTITPTKVTATGIATLTSIATTTNGISGTTNGVAAINGTTSTTTEVMTPPPKPDHSALQARLQAKIEALRAARKADGPNGTPARSRAELIEARRLKQEARRARRLEMQARERAADGDRPETPLSDEERQRLKAEAQLAQLRGTESPLFAPPPKVGTSGLLFGRVGFGGASPDDDAADEAAKINGADDDAKKGLFRDALGEPVHPPRKHKGAVDPKSALRAAEARAARLEGMTDAQREAARRRTAWAAAAARVRGEKALHLDDADPALLRKTVKRRERAKAKGEREWKERQEGVRKASEMKQRKREENLAKRKEEKGQKGKGSRGKKPDGKAKRKKDKQRAFGSLK